jgi:hypothetical protein
MVTKWKLTKPLAECCWDWIRILKNPMKIPLFVNSYPMKISHKHLIHIPFISSWLVGYFGTSFGLGFRTWIFHPTLEHSYHNHSQQEMTFFSWTIPKIHQIDGYGYKMLEVSMQKWYSFHISFSRNFPCFFSTLDGPIASLRVPWCWSLSSSRPSFVILAAWHVLSELRSWPW